ncbi:MAG: sulfur oxidation c-type cytochrome SoxX [Pseudomonadota bacterium]|nr:sulfur oxidation c-type cytochrome SoxX [Pseudomonadota bacterium]
MNFLFFSLIFYFIIGSSFSAERKYAPFIIDYKNFTALKPAHIKKGDLKKGNIIFKSRKTNCLSCHEAPIPEEKFQGNFGPSLLGVGSRYSREEIRIILIDAKITNPDTIMPAYFKKIDYPRTSKEYLGKTILLPEEVEHLVEYLYSIK